MSNMISKEEFYEMINERFGCDCSDYDTLDDLGIDPSDFVDFLNEKENYNPQQRSIMDNEITDDKQIIDIYNVVIC